MHRWVLPAKSGRILSDGHDITSLPSRERVKRQISLVPEGRHLWPGMAVEDNLLMGCYLPSLRSRAEASLARVYDLFPRLKERCRQLACALGRGLMSGPELLMLDEPSLGLAPMLVEEIFGLIRSIAKQGVTILLVGQNINYTLQVSQYGYVMEVGKIALEGPGEMLINNQYVRRAYLGIAE